MSSAAQRCVCVTCTERVLSSAVAYASFMYYRLQLAHSKTHTYTHMHMHTTACVWALRCVCLICFCWLLILSKCCAQTRYKNEKYHNKMFRLTAAHVADPARPSTQFPARLSPLSLPPCTRFCHRQMPIIMSERNDYIKKRLNNFFCRLHVKCFLSRFSELELLQLYL